MYMKFSGPLRLEKDEEGSTWEGGFFWDGRANSLEEQAKGPFLNPMEMNETKEGVVSKVCKSDYADKFKAIYGAQSCNPKNVEQGYNAVAKAIASLERSSVFSPFSSKYDAVMSKQDRFTEQELRGYRLFKDEKKANCAACHSLETDHSAHRALFTDFTYDNIGLPTNSRIPAIHSKISQGADFSDEGLAAVTKRPEDFGKFKVPTLRNISKTAPYMHNGCFTDLRQVIDFYNTRDVKPTCREKLITMEQAEAQNCWPAPESPATMNREELGNLRLSESDVDDLIAFLKTLDDGYSIHRVISK